MKIRTEIPVEVLRLTGPALTGGLANILTSAGSPTKWGFIHKSVS